MLSPISKTNWEGTGVEPDVSVKAANALDKAQELAKSKPPKNDHSKVAYFVSEGARYLPDSKTHRASTLRCWAFVKEPLNLFLKIVLVHHASV